MVSHILSQGAEAIISLENNQVKKSRIKKLYRHQLIDEKLRKTRTRAEAKILQKLASFVNVPKIIKTDETKKEIIMEFIDGKKLSDFLEELDYKKISRKIGELIKKIHDSDIIHGDLTTSNMILKDNKVFLIDFGLSFHSKKIEDKAVDLHLLKQALEAKHFRIADECFNIITEYYKPKNYKKILEQLIKVESRGRYKDRY